MGIGLFHDPKLIKPLLPFLSHLNLTESTAFLEDLVTQDCNRQEHVADERAFFLGIFLEVLKLQLKFAYLALEVFGFAEALIGERAVI